VPLGDDVDGAIDHLYRGLIVDPVGRHYWYLSGHSLHPGRETFRVILVVQVRKQRKMDQSQPLIDDEWPGRVIVGRPAF
jgi:hypothetical protein